MSPTPPSASFTPLTSAALGRADDAVAGAAFACAPTSTRDRVPSPGCVQRDFCIWTTAQRTQMQRLLRACRSDLGLAAVDDERPVLLTQNRGKRGKRARLLLDAKPGVMQVTRLMVEKCSS